MDLVYLTPKDIKKMSYIKKDLSQELKGNKINIISSLQEVSTMFEGFEYGQKKIGKKNVKAAYGNKIEFLDFLV